MLRIILKKMKWRKIRRISRTSGRSPIKNGVKPMDSPQIQLADDSNPTIFSDFLLRFCRTVFCPVYSRFWVLFTFPNRLYIAVYGRRTDSCYL